MITCRRRRRDDLKCIKYPEHTQISKSRVTAFIKNSIPLMRVVLQTCKRRLNNLGLVPPTFHYIRNKIVRVGFRLILYNRIGLLEHSRWTKDEGIRANDYIRMF